jgi:hypothetical protein
MYKRLGVRPDLREIPRDDPNRPHFHDAFRVMGNEKPPPVTGSGAMKNNPAYFRRRRNNNKDNPLKPASASVVGSGITAMPHG